ncbi:hypothetical protein DBR43_30555 [Pedobacter sp. KBW06]|uniref:DUF1266 domain-containing protein n=1 Tax=Pedobacter sp. KBW06 TaxID=2153359 RepID=UPI000F5973BA|nr:DUF1266 domain-containing protein [Pedobacter sp. KBW06]RQO65196.1 hypothetical protein DBR43_30555 [Pedobacter sp. KBW06]
MSSFFKVFNALFKELSMNKNGLNGYDLDCVLVSSMYAEQQSAYLNSYETGLSLSTIKKLVEEYWDVYDRDDALKILIDLLHRNEDEYVDFVYKALEDESNYEALLKANLPNDEGAFEYYLNIYRSLGNTIPELIEENVISHFSELKKIKDSGWNLGRGAFLARCCFELGHLSEEELKDYLGKTHTALKKYCGTWKEYTISYIFGRALWGGANNAGMISIADTLLNDDKSPLKNKAL